MRAEIMRFENRDPEFIQMYKALHNSSVQSIALFISGKSGVGKSRLCEEFLFRQSIKIPIKVKFYSKEGNLENWEGLDDIIKTVNSKAEKDNSFPSFSQWFKNVISFKSGKFIKERMIEGIPFAPLKTGVNMLLSANEFNPKKILDGLTPEDFQIKIEYLNVILGQFNFIIDIENFQSIDNESFRSLIPIIVNSDKNLFILEFTSGNNNNFLKTAMQTFDQEGIIVNHLPLEKLPYPHYRNVANKIESDKLIYSIYNNTEGNLRSIVDIETLLSTQSNAVENVLTGIEDPTFSNINSLDFDAKYLLIAIVAHNGPIKIGVLRHLLEEPLISDVFLDIDTTLEKLISRNLIKADTNENDTILSTDHDKILSIIRKTKGNEKEFLIYEHAWSNIYEKLYVHTPMDMDKGRILLALLYFLMKTDPRRLKKYFSELRDNIFKSSSLLVASNYVQTIASYSTDEYIAKEMLFELLQMFFVIGLYNEGIDFLNKLEGKIDAFIVNVWSILFHYRLEKYEKVLYQIDALLRQEKEQNNQIIFTLNLIKLFSLKSSGKRHECKTLYDILIDDKKNKSLLEYGFLLRFSTGILSRYESLKPVEESIVHFRQFDSPNECAKSKISHSNNLARIGRLDEAKKLLVEADEILSNKIFKQHILQNNFGAILLMTGSTSYEVETYLKKALVTARRPFDRLIIYYNLLIHYVLSKNLVSADRIINILEKLQTEIKQTKIANYNIAYYYKAIGNEGKYNEFINRCISPEDKKGSLWYYRLIEKYPVSDEYEFQAKMEYHPGFLAFWHFEPQFFQAHY